MALTSPGWRERDRRAVVLGCLTAGLVAGGVLTALVLWLLSGLAAPAPRPWRYGAAVAVALLGVLRDAGVLPLPLPQNSRQIPRDVLSRGPAGAARFGLELGTGVRTYLSASTPYVLAAALLLVAPGPLAAALAGAGFGLGRAATPLARHASGAAAGWDDRLHGRLRLITLTSGLAVAALLARGWQSVP